MADNWKTQTLSLVAGFLVEPSRYRFNPCKNPYEPWLSTVWAWDSFCPKTSEGTLLPEHLKGTQLRDVRSITANLSAFAALRGDGTVVTWGDCYAGGNSSRVQSKLQNVRQIQATDKAFAAIVGNGEVVAWGHPDYGGDCSSVQDMLKQRLT
ncbi:unnamed protein product [Symbiodinium necroappetens]|uniref:E3 ubiquitin-protein ligase HERC2 n=1 Tax=Symbiodinium necroappetens TaxID=1628268 RepID=A0A812NW58_9DINO|nr:unnamed protein product [Symbiodinium necroappetens]